MNATDKDLLMWALILAAGIAAGAYWAMRGKS